MTAVRLVLRLKSVKLLVSVIKTLHEHPGCQWDQQNNHWVFWETVGDGLVKKEQDYQSRYMVENKLTPYLHYYGVGMWFIAADKLVGSRGNLT